MKAQLEEDYFIASQWQLMWRKFKKHKLAMIGAIILLCFYITGIFCPFFAPYDKNQRFSKFQYAPPQKIHFVSEDGFHLRPFVYKVKRENDPKTFSWIYSEDKTKIHPIHFFIRGEEYCFLGLFKTDIHFFGVKGGNIFLFGTDELGRDLFSRTLFASRISLTVGLTGVTLSFIIGVIMGGISGYFGGTIDILIQRLIEYLLSIPKIPLWMALSTALPDHWSSIQIFFGITLLLSVVGWCGIARVVRGKFLELREEDFVMAANISGISDFTIILTHLVPSFMSYLIVHLTLAIPSMILGETALSFLGLGIRPPAVSWGTLLESAQSVKVLSLHPWILIPSVFVIISVLAFNLLGDGLRDAADPYSG